ncbi:Arylamine N-acetyltransferase [Mariniflexile rhizosphaerae]|uniref:arylamine N-acetyltransferase family protein n=1 Tax=unclassified Mariniflexile TaxID=2643887 RepID=UPI000CC70F60|nr:arylamine N-acetyltransferase [Mariniflexile sp. TRM1-10]AXP80283.1 Arylamine N-acetyltransferase [Mariniflexile sp. TRM1-10]PLB17982.1 MAG: N-acetyltransferase [Flavobacteriaceae bacterium FS1-H7996/R]
MELQAYLSRINFHDTLSPNKDVLYKLQKHHLLNIPFENLDIHYGTKISLSINDIYRKVVIRKRGGFCYELNGLFHQLLMEIGFNAKLISAQVHTKNGEYSPEYDHMAIIVNLENQDFLVDVGFGKFSLEPLKLELNRKIIDSYGEFQFDKYSVDYYCINELKNNDLIPQYIFQNEERELYEFQERCEFHQTNEDSHFTKKKLISIAKPNGRLTLNNSLLKITRFGIEEEIEFNESEFEEKLGQYFDIKL